MKKVKHIFVCLRSICGVFFVSVNCSYSFADFFFRIMGLFFQFLRALCILRKFVLCDMSCTYYSNFVIYLFTSFKVVVGRHKFLIVGLFGLVNDVLCKTPSMRSTAR